MDYGAFLTMLENLKKKVREFTDALATLDNIADKTANVPELEAERLSLRSGAGFIKNTIDSISGSIDATISFVRGLVGWDNDDENVGNLQAFPLLGIAAVAAAVTAITKWLIDYANFMKRFEVYEQLVSRGTPSAQAWTIAQEAGQQSVVAGIGKALIPLVLIGGAFYLIPKFAPNLLNFRKW